LSQNIKSKRAKTYKLTSLIFVSAFIGAATEKCFSLDFNHGNNLTVLFIWIFLLFLARVMVRGMTDTPKRESYAILLGAFVGLSFGPYIDFITESPFSVSRFIISTVGFIIWFYIICYPLQSRIESIKG